MQQIADWLEKLGMSEYAQRFAENGINVAALPHLTDQDLKDIGVLLGHRRVMLAAISKLAGAAARSAHGTSSESDRSRFALDRLSVNERKQRCGNIQSGIPADVLFGVTAGVATSAGRGFGSGGDGRNFVVPSRYLQGFLLRFCSGMCFRQIGGCHDQTSRNIRSRIDRQTNR